MSVAAPANFNPEEADNLEDVRLFCFPFYATLVAPDNMFAD